MVHNTVNMPYTIHLLKKYKDLYTKHYIRNSTYSIECSVKPILYLYPVRGAPLLCYVYLYEYIQIYIIHNIEEAYKVKEMGNHYYQ